LKLAVANQTRSFPKFLNFRTGPNYAENRETVAQQIFTQACAQFQDRLKRRAQFWSPRGLVHILAIDVAVKNDTLDFLWN
jgi:hypothetical protein